MTLPSGFRLLPEQPLPDSDTRLWEVVDVHYGDGSEWSLKVTLESGSRSSTITFDQVVSFRAQDEGEMFSYWTAREREGVAVGTLYVIERSAYKDELQASGVSGLSGTLSHYLIAGNNLCVEALSDNPPTLASE